MQGSEYAIDRYTAVQLYTLGSARLDWGEQQRGTLQPGCLADIVGYRTNPITCPFDDLLRLRPVVTLVGGRVVYDPQGMVDQEN